jgi:transcriptional regulator GlxA family with amidase domain
MMDLPDPDVPAGVVSWLRSRHEDGAKLVAVCSGAFILAATRLAAGRSVSTHRICAEALAKRFPEISVDTNERVDRRVLDTDQHLTGSRSRRLRHVGKLEHFRRFTKGLDQRCTH